VSDLDTYRLWQAREELEHLRLLLTSKPNDAVHEMRCTLLSHIERAALEAERIADFTGAVRPVTMPWWLE
jgi:hypothetical protein